MNGLVDEESQHKFIPGEISMCSFTIANGIDPNHQFTSLVDPGAQGILKGYGIEAYHNVVAFGLPQQGTAIPYQNLRKIVFNMEAMIEGALGRSTSDGALLFCSKENVRNYTNGLKWLYNRAGVPFNHKLMPLETLVVVLSLCGLECFALRNPKWTFNTVLKRFMEILDRTQDIVLSKDCASHRNSVDPSFVEQTVRIFTEANKEYSQSYRSTGTQPRLANEDTAFPDAMMGAFISQCQVTDYLNKVKFLYMTSLACDWHQDKMLETREGKAYWAQRKGRPRDELLKCSLINVKRQIFLLLDVLLANFNIQAREGFHYPVEDPQIPERESEVEPESETETETETVTETVTEVDNETG